MTSLNVEGRYDFWLTLEVFLLNYSHNGQFISSRLIKTVNIVVYYYNYLPLLRLITLDIFL